MFQLQYARAVSYHCSQSQTTQTIVYSEPIKTRSYHVKLTQSAKARENEPQRVTIGLGFISDWMKNWREFLKRC